MFFFLTKNQTAGVVAISAMATAHAPDLYFLMIRDFLPFSFPVLDDTVMYYFRFGTMITFYLSTSVLLILFKRRVEKLVVARSQMLGMLSHEVKRKMPFYFPEICFL